MLDGALTGGDPQACLVRSHHHPQDRARLPAHQRVLLRRTEICKVHRGISTTAHHLERHMHITCLFTLHNELPG